MIAHADPRGKSRKALRIAVVTQYFYPEVFRINDLVDGLVSRGHQVHVLTGHPNYPTGSFMDGYGAITPRRDSALGAEITRVPLTPRGSGSGSKLFLNYLSFAATATVLGPAFVRGPVDVVFAYEPSPLHVAVPALALARLKRAPAIMWVQDLWPETLIAMGLLASERSKAIASLATGALHRGMDALLVQSEAFRSPLLEQGVSTERIAYVPNWAEDYYRPVEVPADAPERREMPDGFTVLFAGNVGESQGLEVMLNAADHLRHLQDLHWVVLGEGRRLSWLRDHVERRGLGAQVHLLGRRPPETMPSWFALADVLLVTLQANPVYEMTIPSKLQTYLACGRPVVTALNGEGSRVVEAAEAGSTAPAGDSLRLAAAVKGLYNASPEKRVRMGRSGREYYEMHFTREKLIGRIEELMIRYVGRGVASQ